MKLTTRIRNAFKAFSSSEKSFSTDAWRTSYVSTANHPIIKMVESCGDGATIGMDPRRKLGITEAINWAFPFFRRGMCIRSDILGNAEYTHDDEILAKEMNDWGEAFAIHNSRVPDEVIGTGIAGYGKNLLINAFERGQTFAELRLDDFEVLMGINTLKSECFDYVATGSSNNTEKLIYYAPDGSQIDVISSEFFVTYRQTWSNDYTWGVPMAYNADFFANNLLKLLIARVGTHQRLSNPPSITTLSPVAGQFQTDPEVAKFQAIVQSYGKNWDEGVKHMYKTGRPFDMLVGMPAEIKMDTKMFGAGQSGLTNFTAEADLYIDQMMALTGVPLEFLGRATGGGGLGSGRFEAQKNLMMANVETDRDTVGAKILDLGQIYLKTIKASPRAINGLGVQFTGTEVDDKKLAADTELVDAQSMAQNWLTFVSMSTEQGPNDTIATDFAESIGQDWKPVEGLL